ncbi:hypothetical protein [Methanocaldococcus fervens]|uniref:Uncharacterized protein n=1 Tax=Methanocaldococcus fervens (strain DSM 4213 / JCM 15782 / AG86) TaxID=573064 RepID=C7P9N3_METFA|nr:hypothetical protein [Methanocaldococcus fervens]ACV25390.1 hypothetical protein Mefer_1587 [Methanocaldococcus fervens AG86]
MIQRIMAILILVLLSSAYANSIVVYNPETGTYYTCYPKNITANGKTVTYYILNISSATKEDNLTIIHKIIIENQTAVIVYDANMVKAYQALIAELQRNITRLQKELHKKNKELSELITYKKKNIELQKNISKLKNEITMLKAERDMLKEQNKQYRDLINDLIIKSSNSTLEESIEKEKAENKRWNAIFTALGIAVVGVCALGMILRRYIKRHECPL